MKRDFLHPLKLMVLGMLTLGLPACTGEVVDPEEGEVGEAEQAACDVDWDCEPPPPQPKPDLVVVPFSTCQLINPYTVRVTVKNIGEAYAKPSKTAMNFWNFACEGNAGGLGIASTPYLYPGETATVDLYQPNVNCAVCGCLVEAYADWYNVVSESNESNNTSNNEPLCY